MYINIKRGDAGFPAYVMDSYSLASEFLKIFGLLGLLIVSAVVLVRFRKGLLKPGGPELYLQVVDSLPLGGERAICIIRAGQSYLLIGLAGSSISFLKEIPQSDFDNLPQPENRHNLPNGTKSGFISRFTRKISQRTCRLDIRKTFMCLALAIFFACCFQQCVWAAPDNIIPNIDIRIDGESGQGGLLNALGILGILTVLTLAPAILILTTSFTRIAIVFSFLRAGMGTQQTPPNQVLIGLALLLTFFIMTPTWGQINELAVTPYMSGEITAQEAISLGQEPVKEFMLRQTRERDLALFIEMGQTEMPSAPEEMPFIQIVPAFAISELKTAFEMGFILFLPFLVIDMVVASTLMSMGMLMLPPVLISLPFKLLLFVLVDGWNLITRSLIGSFR